MPLVLSNNERRRLLRRGPIGFREYSAWLDGCTTTRRFYLVCTRQVSVRDAQEVILENQYRFVCDRWKPVRWNNGLGWCDSTEVYDPHIVSEHADCIVRILDTIGTCQFLVQQSGRQWPWWPEPSDTFPFPGVEVSQKLTWLNRHMPEINWARDAVAMLFTEGLSEFLPLFIDYPYLLRRRGIDCVCLTRDLLVGLSHHLTVDFATSDSGLAEAIRENCEREGLNVLKSV